MRVGNQLPILLISFSQVRKAVPLCWESVTNPLDKLYIDREDYAAGLGISYQSS